MTRPKPFMRLRHGDDGPWYLANDGILHLPRPHRYVLVRVPESVRPLRRGNHRSVHDPRSNSTIINEWILSSERTDLSQVRPPHHGCSEGNCALEYIAHASPCTSVNLAHTTRRRIHHVIVPRCPTWTYEKGKRLASPLTYGRNYFSVLEVGKTESDWLLQNTCTGNC